MTDEKERSALTRSSTIAELFSHIDLPDGMFNVLPVTVQEDDYDTQLMIIIRGPREDASIIMAKLMTEVDNLFELLEQADATAQDNKFVV